MIIIRTLAMTFLDKLCVCDSQITLLKNHALCFEKKKTVYFRFAIITFFFFFF